MISVTEYLMGRDKEFPLDIQQARNMAELLSRVNWLFGTLELHATVSSGYRPSAINKRVNGAKNSAHMTCEAIDLKDPGGLLSEKMLDHLDILEKCGLYLENPKYTIKNGVQWTHLQSRAPKSGSRVFNP
jgi:hypothetical protein